MCTGVPAVPACLKIQYVPAGQQAAAGTPEGGWGCLAVDVHALSAHRSKAGMQQHCSTETDEVFSMHMVGCPLSSAFASFVMLEIGILRPGKLPNMLVLVRVGHDGHRAHRLHGRTGKCTLHIFCCRWTQARIRTVNASRACRYIRYRTGNVATAGACTAYRQLEPVRTNPGMR